MYKLKYWIYGDYDCEEMELQLNDMAAKGYKLRTICTSDGSIPMGGHALKSLRQQETAAMQQMW